MNLEKFIKNKKQKKIIIASVIGILFIIGAIFLYRTYAYYEEKKTFNVLQGRIPEFSQGDLQLAITLDGESVDSITKIDSTTNGGYYKIEADCGDTADITWDTSKWGALITNIRSSKVVCTIKFETYTTLEIGDVTPADDGLTIPYTATGAGLTTTCKYGTEEGNYTANGTIINNTCVLNNLEQGTYYYKICTTNQVGTEVCETGPAVFSKLYEAIAIGDYVSYTPTSTTYTPDSTLTGYTGTQNTLNPSELNLWRVIRKNDDGTIDMVSQYVSSKTVYFRGYTGFKKFVGTLNTIAKQYETEGITSGSRYMGYNGQIENCTDTTSTACPTDELYTTDTGLVTTAIGDLIGYKVSSTSTATAYWLASRDWVSSTRMDGRFVLYSGGVISMYLVRDGTEYGGAYAVRPIVTLKSGLSATGSGTSSSPYVLN